MTDADRSDPRRAVTVRRRYELIVIVVLSTISMLAAASVVWRSSWVKSLITWYSRKQKWDLSPCYEKDNLHFERFIKPACLFCHSNRFDHVAGTENRYRPPNFMGHAIGCERCHGPGELHVRTPERLSDEPPNIVNPARLQPALREAVCQQCYLQGDIRIVRAGRSLSDYRPGLPLSSVESVFVKAASFATCRVHRTNRSHTRPRHFT
jgi:hypothetical protein